MATASVSWLTSKGGWNSVSPSSTGHQKRPLWHWTGKILEKMTGENLASPHAGFPNSTLRASPRGDAPSPGAGFSAGTGLHTPPRPPLRGHSGSITHYRRGLTEEPHPSHPRKAPSVSWELRHHRPQAASKPQNDGTRLSERTLNFLCLLNSQK